MFGNRRKSSESSTKLDTVSRLKSDEGFISPVTIARALGAGVIAVSFAAGFINGMGIKIGAVSELTEGSEFKYKPKEIIPEPIPEFVTVLGGINGPYKVALHLEIDAGPIHENIPMPGTETITEFTNDVPIRIIIKGSDLGAIDFKDGDRDPVTGQIPVEAVIYTSKLRFDAEILEGVQLEAGKPRPLIVDKKPALDEAVEDAITGPLNRAIAVCELIPFGEDELCQKLDIVNIREILAKIQATTNSNARVAALREASECQEEIWGGDSNNVIPAGTIKAAIVDAAKQNVLKYRPETPEDKITVRFVGRMPDFTASIIDDYVKEGKLVKSDTGPFTVTNENNLVVTCEDPATNATGDTSPSTNTTDTDISAYPYVSTNYSLTNATVAKEKVRAS